MIVMLSNETCISIARLIYPDAFADDCPALSSTKKRMKGIEDITVRRFDPPKKHSSDHYRVIISYRDYFVLDNGEWKSKKVDFPLTNETDELIVIKREDIKKNFLEVMEAMRHFFWANVLLLEKYTGDNHNITDIKKAFRANKMWLLFENELPKVN